MPEEKTSYKVYSVQISEEESDYIEALAFRMNEVCNRKLSADKQIEVTPITLLVSAIKGFANSIEVLDLESDKVIELVADSYPLVMFIPSEYANISSGFSLSERLEEENEHLKKQVEELQSQLKQFQQTNSPTPKETLRLSLASR